MTCPLGCSRLPPCRAGTMMADKALRARLARATPAPFPRPSPTPGRGAPAHHRGVPFGGPRTCPLRMRSPAGRTAASGEGGAETATTQAAPRTAPGASVAGDEPADDVLVTEQVAEILQDDSKPLTERVGGAWDSLPYKLRLLLALSSCFVICNMDKVNISVAIIPMAKDLGWSPSVKGLVQSSFFWGYMVSQLPGGFLANKFGGRTVLPGGVFLWSAATAAVPLAAQSLPTLCLSRAAVGLGEAVAPSSAADLVARCIPANERARAMSFIFGGLHVGSITGLLVAPGLIESFGWESVFIVFGGLGLLWTAWWEAEMKRMLLAGEGPEAAPLSLPKSDSDTGALPWRGFLRSRPLQALAFTHFCNNWMHYTMLAWLPTYFTETLHLELSQAAQVSLLPPLAAIAVSTIAGPSADGLIERGWPTSRVRKTAQALAFLGPLGCLVAVPAFQDQPWVAIALIAGALGLNSFALAGLYCNHQDLSPRYASVLLGMTNTAAAVPGIFGVTLTGLLLDQTDSDWGLSLFYPSAMWFAFGAAVFVALGSSDKQDFDGNNAPFAWEARLPPWIKRRFAGADVPSADANGNGNGNGNGKAG
ncbi:unnamed protein product [Pedinophyceae sp. YPF-701]|nr:unnamed protein product [Pedinophyceae sp. YPF-701]